MIIAWIDLFAQNSKQKLIVHKNGSIVCGEISHQTPDSLFIKTACDNLIIFAKSDLKNISEESSINHSNKSEFDKQGLYNYSTIGFLTGKSELTDNASFSFQTSLGYQFSHLLGVGIGVGIEKLKTEIVPVMLSVKSNLMRRNNIPTINFRVGYSFPLSTEKQEDMLEYTYKGGFCLGFDIGGTTIKSAHREFSITVGYQYQVITEELSENYWYYNQDIIERSTYQFNKIAIRIGFLFK